ncbi:universal stress protein [Natronolimnobius baerhuensis]|uniref:Universal stress protein UspA n=1 Tax=Natronolimnobius baerhuensis TaxID=253108 RepID=A0A202ECS6_9EURY|nr:universal stress protein [Natronolimnobius baerhuensis]OVE86076.1 universal stress protein UspA [Natronolimnobius baerhuensis]
MYESILVATDGSDGATTAVEHALGLARQLEAPLFGLAVLESRTAYDNAIVDPTEATERQRERAEATLSELESMAADIDVDTAIRTGVPHEEIRAYAAEIDADVIVIGARGRSAFTGALLGSTVDATLRHAERPVLVVETSQ